MMNGNQMLSVLARSDKGSSISVVLIYSRNLRSSRFIDGNSAYNGFSAQEVSIIENIALKLSDRIVDLQGLKERYPHLRNLPRQSYNLKEVQFNLGQDCYDIHHQLEFKQSDDKAGAQALKLKIGWALNGPLPANQTEALATTRTSIKEDKLANQFTKSWDSVAKIRCKLNNFYSAMGQLKSPEKRLQKDKSVIKKPLTMTSMLVMSTKSKNLSSTKPETSFSGICHIILLSTRK